MDQPATLICKLRATTGPHLARLVSAWQVRYHTKVIRFEGFMSADLLPPPNPKSNDWMLVVRFRTGEQLQRWMHSAERSWLAAEAEPLLADGEVFIETTSHDNHADHPVSVTEIIRSEIRPGMEDAYRAWAQKTQHTQSQFEGYRGVHVIAPIPGQSNEWTTLLKFDTEDNLDKWRYSAERAALLEEARLVIDRTEVTRLSSPFPGWVPLDPFTGKNSPRWKTALLVLLGLFPVVMLTIHFINPLLRGLNSSVANLLGNVVTVSATTYLTMPLLVRKFAWWLFPGKTAPPNVNLRGVLMVLGIIVVEVLAFWGMH